MCFHAMLFKFLDNRNFELQLHKVKPLVETNCNCLNCTIVSSCKAKPSDGSLIIS